MDVYGKVVSIGIDVPVKKKDGGTYQGWKLVYEDKDGDVKTIAKHMNSLKYANELHAGLKALVAGDDFVLSMEKEGEFWNPKSIVKGAGVPMSTAKPAATIIAGKAAPGGGSWQTAEERAATQKYIVRQSSITNALKLLELRGDKKATVESVILVAEEFEAWVFGTRIEMPDALTEDPTNQEDDIPV